MLKLSALYPPARPQGVFLGVLPMPPLYRPETWVTVVRGDGLHILLDIGRSEINVADVL